ncbi:hypothetical protein ACFC18_49460, partial [Streptomyces sp. NPDC056121]
VLLSADWVWAFGFLYRDPHRRAARRLRRRRPRLAARPARRRQPCQAPVPHLRLLRRRPPPAGELGDDPWVPGEITVTDVTAALSPLRGWQRRNAIAALRSLFRFAKKRGLIFANPTARLKTQDIQRNLLPITNAEVLAVQRVAVTPRNS